MSGGRLSDDWDMPRVDDDDVENLLVLTWLFSERGARVSRELTRAVSMLNGLAGIACGMTGYRRRDEARCKCRAPLKDGPPSKLATGLGAGCRCDGSKRVQFEALRPSLASSPDRGLRVGQGCVVERSQGLGDRGCVCSVRASTLRPWAFPGVFFARRRCWSPAALSR